LYEGGIRVPLIVRWKGRIPAARTDSSTLFSTLDLLPSFCALAGIGRPAGDFDGENMSPALFGRSQKRVRDLLWDYGRNPSYVYPGKQEDRSPNLAIRSGRWKLLINDDSSRVELYDLSRDETERDNAASRHREVAEQLSAKVLAWRKSLPVLTG
jgi:arylsulfatase A-like enzyme